MDELILSFLERKISSEELQVLRKWVKSSVENESYFKQMEEAWLLTASVKSKENYHKEQAYQNFSERIKNGRGPVRNIKILRNIINYAALMVLSFGIGVLVTHWREVANSNKEVLTYSLEAPRKAKLKINLPDGSLVWLNAASTLSYNSGFGIDNRDLSLQGEGYFEISKNPELPLIVSSGTSRVKVLGTKFNVQNYEDDEIIRVALLEGMIDYSDDRYNKSIVLKPNQILTCNKKSMVLTVKNVNAGGSSSWINGEVFFNEEKFGYIAKVIERAFDVTVRFEDENLKNLIFYGDLIFEVEDVVQVMEVMAATDKFAYRYDNKKKEIYIYH